jgi:hypothetical protein
MGINPDYPYIRLILFKNCFVFSTADQGIDRIGA